MRYVFTNPEAIPILEPGKQYTTQLVGMDYTSDGYVVTLKYVGKEFDPTNPACIFPVSDNTDYHVHPFVD